MLTRIPCFLMSPFRGSFAFDFNEQTNVGCKTERQGQATCRHGPVAFSLPVAFSGNGFHMGCPMCSKKGKLVKGTMKQMICLGCDVILQVVVGLVVTLLFSYGSSTAQAP